MDKLLNNTCIPNNVDTDSKNMKSEFEEIILPFLKEHKECFRYLTFISFFFLIKLNIFFFQ